VSGRNKKRRQVKQGETINYSPIERHKRERKMLTPPMMTVSNLQLASWPNDRLPELLWAAIIVSHLPQDLALSLFRNVATYGRELRRDGEQAPGDVTHSGIASMEPQQIRELLAIVCRNDHARTLLASLLLLEELPCREIWQEFLTNDLARASWQVLGRAVALTLGHQSQEATDCRWLKVMFLALKGQICFRAGKDEQMTGELMEYPNVDMQKVRPLIRAMEGGVSMLPLSGEKTDWPRKFWSQCLRDTPCSSFRSRDESGQFQAGTTSALISAAQGALVRHANQTRKTTATDPKHDVVFGTALFCLGILEELLRVGIGQSVVGRSGLRTLLECYVTLEYLTKENSADLWKSYRVYGAGQAKLAFLKLANSQAATNYISIDTLKSLANEDVWQEFLPIDLGHWAKSDLRALSEKAGVKDVYDRFYPWTSTYGHGHWAAIRDSVFEVCANPLHRIHRIPLSRPRTLGDVVPDACEIIDRLLAIVDKCYPDLAVRVTSSPRQSETEPLR
jgi:uncharacterized protein DUF5677